MDKTNVIKELNTVLKGEQMAVQSYDQFLSTVKDEKIRDRFQNFKSDHKEHADKVAQRIRSLGGIPDFSTGVTGVFSHIKLEIETKGKDSYDVLKRAYEGEDKGIAMVEEVIKGDLDEESMKLVENILSQDHDHLKSMLNLMPDNRLH